MAQIWRACHGSRRRRKQQTATVEELTRAGQCKAIDKIYEKIEEMRKAM